MIDTDALEVEITKKKSSYKELASACNVTLPTFYRKMRTQGFSVNEAFAVSRKLKLKKRDMGRIFFADEHN